MVIFEELQGADAPMYGTSVSLMVAKALLHHGTDEMRRDVVPEVLRGETICVLGFSEPEAGSDVANAQTRAVRDGDEWVINGSKMFTTNAQIADYVYLLTRTNPDVPKHKGLTTFLVPLDRDGVEVQAVYTLSGERTNITFYNDVRGPGLGPHRRRGRRLAGAHRLAHGRAASSFGPRIQRLLDEAEAWAVETGRVEDPSCASGSAGGGGGRGGHPAPAPLHLDGPVRHPPHGRGADGEAVQLGGAHPRVPRTSSTSSGPTACGPTSTPPPCGGQIEYLMRFSLGTTIYAGTSEIQRNLIAQRGLGLPR